MSESDKGFRCTVCGECCRGDQKVWLNPTDLLRLAGHLDFPGVEELELRRIVIAEAAEHGIRRPRLRFIPTPAGLSCRFLINDLDESGRLWGKCALHGTPAKPLVCRLAPLSRSINLDTGEEEWREIPPVIGCPGWTSGSEPSPEGRRIPTPELGSGLRDDLDGETEYFRTLNEE